MTSVYWTTRKTILVGQDLLVPAFYSGRNYAGLGKSFYFVFSI